MSCTLATRPGTLPTTMSTPPESSISDGSELRRDPLQSRTRTRGSASFVTSMRPTCCQACKVGATRRQRTGSENRARADVHS